MHTLILGFDSFDPEIFERLASQGKLPNLTKYSDMGKYSKFEVSDPPQTEVSWTSIATGLNPGGHGIFDFVHREPSSYTPFVSLLPTERKLGGTQFVPPYNARTIFEEATRQGYPATTLWWPATFPARLESPVRTIPGLGTPDIMGRLGVGSLYTTESGLEEEDRKTTIKILKETGKGKYSSSIDGPAAKKRGGTQVVTVDLKLDLNDDGSANLIVDKQSLQLAQGEWSPIIEVTFKMGLFVSVRAVTKAILTQTSPEVHLYFLPLQIHPLSSPWRYATPPSFVKQIWKTSGPYLSLGWPQDTTGLEEGCISDDQFMSLCTSIHAAREYTYLNLIDSFNEGILAAVFDSLDRIQHMFRRDRPDLVDGWYVKLDDLVGRVEKRMQALGDQNLKFFVLSDHGFSDFQHKVNLNRWLVENEYLITNNSNGSGGLGDVDWSRSQAYAVGLNSLYVNLKNREGQGMVASDQILPLLSQLSDQLKDWRGPDGRPVIERTLLRDEAYSGPYTPYGPDILIGYSPGYRASAETGLGKWNENTIEPNNDHWGADHCIDSLAVPGVIFCNQGFGNISSPSYRDIPVLTLGKELEQPQREISKPPSSTGGEDKEVLEERLKDLGYL
jgi:predicted AlkP superfamily phosphohydrolase/phosphomutase